MVDHEPKLIATVSLFDQAALGIVTWTEAMEAFASTVNARTGQLIGFGANQTIPFSVMTAVAETAAEEFAAVGGGDPAINSRVRVGLSAPELAWRDDRHFTVAKDGLATPALHEWHMRHRIGYTCLTPLISHDDFTVGVASINDPDQGPLGDEDRAIFEILSKELRRSVRLQIAIEGRQAQLLAGTFEAFDQAVFICDARCRVISRSASTEQLLAEGRWLTVRDGKLRLSDMEAQRRLEAALDRRAGAGMLGAAGREDFIITRDKEGFALPLELGPLPAQGSITMLDLSLIIAHPPQQQEERIARMARSVFSLTPTESLIAAYVASGHGPAKISERCGVARGTVRTHLKRIFDKTGARSQVELVALLTSYR